MRPYVPLPKYIIVYIRVFGKIAAVFGVHPLKVVTTMPPKRRGTKRKAAAASGSAAAPSGSAAVVDLSESDAKPRRKVVTWLAIFDAAIKDCEDINAPQACLQGMTPLSFATEHGYLDAVKDLCKRADVTRANPDGSSPVFLAAQGRPWCLAHLHAQGAPLTTKWLGSTLLHGSVHAVAKGHRKAVKCMAFILEHGCIDEETAPHQLKCPITKSIMSDPVVACDGHTYERSAIQRSLSRIGHVSPVTNAPMGPDLRDNFSMKSQVSSLMSQYVDINAVQKDGHTALTLAASEKRADMVQMLCNAGANMDIVRTRRRRQYSALTYAVKNHSMDCATILISSGAVCRPFDLVLAAKLDHCDMVRHLASHVEDHHEALRAAVWYGKPANATVLSERGNVDERISTSEFNNYNTTDPTADVGSAILHIVAEVGDICNIQFVVNELHGSVDVVDSCGRTPLWRACMCRRDESVRALVRLGANVNYRMVHHVWEQTLFTEVIRNNYIGMVRLLHELGANTGSQSPASNERTPLMVAANHEHLDILELLIQWMRDADN